MQSLLNWYKQHLFNSWITAVGEGEKNQKEKLTTLFYKSLCQRRALSHMNRAGDMLAENSD